ncbi:quinone reductase-like [Bolinopsis microptera]|uniref:quinone reductase-like n=1 Tax=Bolinopsis microptera TaxID=2820187 RepID=UPI00307940F1
MADKLKTILFLSSCRKGASFTGEGSWGDRVGKAMKEILEEEGLEVSLWDPKDSPYTILEQPLHLVPDASGFPQWMHDKKKELEEADSFIICSAEYNSALPPALTNMLDHYPPAAYKDRPVALLTYSVGPFGGCRIQINLKAHVTELGMVPVPASCTVMSVGSMFDEEGNLTDDRVKANMVKQAKELKWYAEALKSYKQVRPVPVPPKKQ